MEMGNGLICCTMFWWVGRLKGILLFSLGMWNLCEEAGIIALKMYFDVIFNNRLWGDNPWVCRNIFIFNFLWQFCILYTHPTIIDGCTLIYVTCQAPRLVFIFSKDTDESTSECATLPAIHADLVRIYDNFLVHAVCVESLYYFLIKS